MQTMAPKLYDSKAWLMRKHHTEGKSIDEIAKLCGATSMTIRRKFKQFGIKIVN